VSHLGEADNPAEVRAGDDVRSNGVIDLESLEKLLAA
jgi:hypothetical protein